jgi:SulP family sulfate permease
LLTVIFDLVVAIEIGIVLAALLFMKRMADVAGVHSWKYIDEDNDEDEDNGTEGINLREVPSNTLVYEIEGPMFFAATDKFMDISLDSSKKAIILRMRSVPAMDASGLRILKKVFTACRKKKITLIFSHVQEQPMSLMVKAGFDQEIGIDNFCDNIDTALARAASLNK